MKLVILDGKALNPGDLSWKPLEQLGSVSIYEQTASAAEAIHRPFVLGITGPIHAGKSTAAAYFRSQGYHYFDADKAVWELYEDCKVQKEIQKIAGKKTVKKTGNLPLSERKIVTKDCARRRAS